MEDLAVIADGFWRGRRVLLTGHTGFKGGWLAVWLNTLGAEVTGLGLPPTTDPSLYELARVDLLCSSVIGDVRAIESVKSIVAQCDPEIVLHLAGQPLVRVGYQQPVDTIATNVMGTTNLLEALRTAPSVRSIVVVTSDKVYGTGGSSHPRREPDPLGGDDPYSASKAAADLIAQAYGRSFFDARGVGVACARAGNVIGGGDWAPDRLLPDAITAWQSGQTLRLRRPDAVRPWQHVLEPIHGYLVLAQAMAEDPTGPTAYNFGPPASSHRAVAEVVSLAAQSWGDARFTVETEPDFVEADTIDLDISTTQRELGIEPHWNLDDAVDRTIRWYRDLASGADAADLCRSDIAAFEVGRSHAFAS